MAILILILMCHAPVTVTDSLYILYRFVLNMVKVSVLSIALAAVASTSNYGANAQPRITDLNFRTGAGDTVTSAQYSIERVV